MLKSYFRTAWRSLWRNTTTSVISIAGLAFGISCFFLLSTYILNELRYDGFHEKADRIAFISFSYKSPSDPEPVQVEVTPTAVVPVAKREFPQVEEGVRLRNYGNKVVSRKDKYISEKDIWMADSSFFNIFSFRFLAGDPATALKDPYSFVITRSTAKRYFGDEPALGQTLKIDTTAWKVTGVIEDIPSYSSIKFNMIGSYITLASGRKEEWGSANDLSFLLLKSPAQHQQIAALLNDYVKKQFPEDEKAGYEVRFQAEPLTRVHLYSKAAARGSVQYLYVFGGIAVLLLLIACINYTNLFTAKSTERSLEIGLRKVLGAAKGNIFLQFMAEAALVTLLSILFAALITAVALPLFNDITGLELGYQVWNGFYFSVLLIALFVVVTSLAGAWPALVISRFQPISALKNMNQPGGRSQWLRKSLVVFQFTVSIIFIIATLVARKQLYFIQHTNTGIDRSQVVVLDGNSIKLSQLDALKSRMTGNKTIESVTACYDSPVDIQGGYSISVAGRTNNEALSITAIPVDIDFVHTLGMKIIAGTDFTYADEQQVKLADYQQRKYAFMLNEKALEALDLKAEEAIGRDVNLNGRKGSIKAVLKDFNFASLHTGISPLVIFAEYDWFGKIMIKTSEANTKQALADIEKSFKTFYPNAPFEYHFLDDEYNELYKSEQRTADILNIFSVVTIIISCLGLFGLVVFMTVQRTREIGIRKVMGATTANITLLLTKQFVQLVLIAILIATPIAWVLADRWLQDFAFRIPVPWAMFIAAAAIALTIAFLTVAVHAMQAAGAKPVKSLRNE